MTTTSSTPLSSESPGLDESDVAARTQSMAAKPLPPRFINQGDHIPLAVWTWQAHTLGRAASVSEIEAFLRAPCPGGLELTEDDADRALAALVKY